MLRGAYAIVTDLAAAPLALWLKRRAARGKELPERLAERFGTSALPRPAGRLAWFHGASVGECLSLLPLMEAVIARGWQVLITSGTVTSAKLMAERLPKGARHQFVPLDRRAWARRFLDHWHPDLVLWAESELWPNMLLEIGRRGTPAVLVNARLSDRAFRGWRRWPGFARQTLAAFTLVLAQSEVDRSRFADLGARDVRVSGNIKLAAPPPPADGEALAALRTSLGGRPRWLAASIHPGEDAIVAAVHGALKPRYADLLTMVVPRHADKGVDMAAVFAAEGLSVARRSLGETVQPGTDILLADTMGELGLFFRATDLVFMGKSLAVGGGQNPAEPALLGCALVFGPDMSNFRETAAELVTAGGAIQVENAAALTGAVDRLLGDAARRRAMGEKAEACIAAHGDALKETLQHLAPWLAPG